MPRKMKTLTAEDMQTFRGRFAARLRQLMKDNDITSTQLAKAVGVGEPAVRMWTRGDCFPPVDRLELIGEAIGVKDYRTILPAKS